MKFKLKTYLILIGLIVLLSLPLIKIPWGGAEDTDGDGKVDTFYDGTKKVSVFELGWMVVKPKI